MRNKTYTRTETVKARKVTGNDGEDVVTSDGVRHAVKGDYVVERDGATEVHSGEDFENAGWKTKTKRKTNARKSTPPTPRRAAGQPNPDETLSPAERVERARAAKRA